MSASPEVAKFLDESGALFQDAHDLASSLRDDEPMREPSEGDEAASRFKELSQLLGRAMALRKSAASLADCPRILSLVIEHVDALAKLLAHSDQTLEHPPDPGQVRRVLQDYWPQVMTKSWDGLELARGARKLYGE
jgi:hypothetical protein